MLRIEEVKAELRGRPRRWLVTGVAGFIGSHLLQELLTLDQTVVGLDNFATGSKANLETVLAQVPPRSAARFRFIEGDIRDLSACREACDGIEVVLHQAALGSVPRSLKDPLQSHQVNVDGFLHMLIAARDARVRRFVYAASSSAYGDHPGLPKVEDQIGKPLSPYALTKRVNELYAQVFGDCYGLETIGLRYFNVFGPRQDPNGPYAAVIPKWIHALRTGLPCIINGDGETSRDFSYVANVVQANLLAALTASGSPAINQIFNIACGGRTTLNELFSAIRDELQQQFPALSPAAPEYHDFRPGDVRHSHANIDRATQMLGYRPTHGLTEGLVQTVRHYLSRTQR